MTDKKDSPARKVRTPPFRLSFPWILTPKEDKGDDGKPKKTYQLSMLLPPGADLKPFKAALRAAMAEKFGDDSKKWPNLRHKPDDVIRDFGQYNAGAKKPLAGDWTGWTLVRANAPESYPPGVVGATKGPDGKFPAVRDAREVYGGRWARATIEAFHFAHKGGGVTFGLKNVQLLKHDTNFSGAVTAPEDDFDNASEEWAGEADAFDRGGEAENTKTASDWD